MAARKKKADMVETVDEKAATADVNEYDNQTESRWQARLVRVIAKGKGFVGVDFDGFGVRIDMVFGGAVGDSMAVRYMGEIGKCDFRIGPG